MLNQSFTFVAKSDITSIKKKEAESDLSMSREFNALKCCE